MFLPLGDDNSQRKLTPYVTWLILVANVIVWYFQLTLGERFTYGYSAIPYEILNGVDLIGTKILTINHQHLPLQHTPGPHPIQLTILSSMFMHGSWAHIIGNMTYLLIFADQIEDILGHLRFFLFYILCGIAASLSHIAFASNSIMPSLGASGAIAGVLGAYLISYPSNPVKVLYFGEIRHIPASIVLGGWIVLQLVSQISVVNGQSDGIAYMAHIGGFFAGLILLSLLKNR